MFRSRMPAKEQRESEPGYAPIGWHRGEYGDLALEVFVCGFFLFFFFFLHFYILSLRDRGSK